MTRYIVSMAIALAFAAPSHAQVSSMSLRGNVQSDNRQALPGAAVTLIHLPSGARYMAASNATGYFQISNLLAGGPYIMKVGEGGYRAQTVESIFLEKGKAATFIVTLSRVAEGEKIRASRADRSAAPASAVENMASETPAANPVSASSAPAPAPAAAPAPTPAPAAALAPAAAPAGAAAEAAAPRQPAGTRYRRYPYTPSTPKKVADPIVPGRYDVKTGNYLYDTGRPTTLQLPGGGGIAAVGINSTESYLHRFLTNPQAQVDTLDLTQGWFNFDRVFFMPGKATLTPESVAQLRNIATLLKAYPKARIKLGGYTDSTGTYKVNRLLSEARARTAWASLVDMGISPARIDARGYGPRYSIAPNTTEEGRAMNRRLSVKVLQK